MWNPDVRDSAISEIMSSLRRMIKSLQDYSQRVSSHFGVTGPQLWVLKTLYQEGSLSLGELSKMMYLNPSTITGVVDRLEGKKYVSRSRSEKDRRVVTVRLTPKGARLAKRAPKPIQGKLIYGLRQLEEEELLPIQRSIQKIVEMMEAQDVEVTFVFDEEPQSQ